MAADLRLHLERVLPAPPERVFALNTSRSCWHSGGAPTGSLFQVSKWTPVSVVATASRCSHQTAMPSSSRASSARSSPEPAWRTRFDGNRPTPTTVRLWLCSRSTLSANQPRLTVDQGDFATEGRLALHVQGWSESIDRLEELIASQPQSAP